MIPTSPQTADAAVRQAPPAPPGTGPADEELRQRLLVIANDEGIWDWDLRSGAVWYSPRWRRMLGYEDGEIAPHIDSLCALLHPEDRERIAEEIGRFLASPAPSYAAELRVRHSDGVYRWLLLRAAAQRDETGRALRLVSSTLDISQRKATEARCERLYEHLLEAQAVTHIGSWRFDLATQRVDWTPELFRLYGLDPMKEAPSYERYLQLIPPEVREVLDERVRWAVARGEPYSLQYWVTLPDGRRRRIDSRGRARRDAEGRVVELFGTCRDVTDSYLAEEELRRAQGAAEEASRIKSRFLANMSHEIRTPMNGMLGVLDLLRDAMLSDEQRELLRAAAAAGRTLLGLLNDFLDIAKIEAGRLELEEAPFLLRPLIEEVVAVQSIIARDKGVALRADFDEDVPQAVRGDAVRLKQVVFNLISNAVKFTARGEVRLRLRREAGDRGRLRCSVRDTGVGIPAERLPRIFEAFTQADESVTRRFGGTGLGLTICRSLVASMGGELEVESAPGVGSTFSFTVRLPQVEPPQSEAAPAPAEAPAAPRRVLVAEDNPLNARILRIMLERLGHQVTHADDGGAALRCWERGGYDLVLMDVQMPELDGLEATRRIRAVERGRSLPRTPIVALTANALRGDEDLCREAGMDGYLSKPVSLAQLAATLAATAATAT